MGISVENPLRISWWKSPEKFLDKFPKEFLEKITGGIPRANFQEVFLG